MTDRQAMQLETLERQRQYVAQQKAEGLVDSVVYGGAFLRGMRDIGYKSPSWALAELIDNSVQGNARRIEVVPGFSVHNSSEKKHDHLAIIDDGVGMIPGMISQSVRWGGTDREGDRTGFGRFGYGLPSASVSIARIYHVFSKTDGGSWHRVSVDVEALGRAASKSGETVRMLASVQEDPPAWVFERATLFDASPDSGTVILLDDIDRMKESSGWVLRSAMKSKFLGDLGVIYRTWLGSIDLAVDGTRVEAVDPLFLMPQARWYDENNVRPEKVKTRVMDLEAPSGATGQVRIRASVMSPAFSKVDPSKGPGGGTNSRFKVLKDYNGLLVCRHGRQIDCIQPWWTKFQNFDAYVKVEIDFDASLDELFGMTTAKQQIVVRGSAQDKLRNGVLEDLIRDMRVHFNGLRDGFRARFEDSNSQDGEPRPAVAAMHESEKFDQTPKVDDPEHREEGEEQIRRKASEIAEVSGQTAEEVIDRLIEQTQKSRYEVKFAAENEGPFFRPARLGEQKQVIINTSHPFYSRVYDRAPEAKSSLEVLLLVLAESELKALGDVRRFYAGARSQWSDRLRFALEALESDESIQDTASVVAERLQTEVSASDD